MKFHGTIASILILPILISLTGCSGAPSNPALNMAGTWTVTTVSTQAHKGFSGTAALSQTGQGLGVNGATTLAATIGQISVSQTGTALTGTITNSLKKVGYNFIGTLSSGNITITGSTPCYSPSTTQTTSITGAITSNTMQGTYTISGGSSCGYSSDAGTFVATKQ
jgi:hypothetical protein